MDILTPLNHVAALINDAGLTASTDPTKLQPPCAWVHADRVRIVTLGGGIELSTFVDLVVPDYGPSRSLQALSALLGQVLTVLDPDGPVELDRAVELAQGGILPAFRIPVTVTT